MANSLSPDDLRTGQLIDGNDTPYQSCSLSYEHRVGPVLSVPYVQRDVQFSHTEQWFQERPPESLIFVDNLGTVTLTGLKVRSVTGNTYALGRLRSDVAVFGRPRELKPEYQFKTLTSRIDGLEDFASFSSVASEVEQSEHGHRVTVVVESKDKVEFDHGDFQYTIRARTPWTSTQGQSFAANTEAVIETTSPDGATADAHLIAQWPIRALLIMANGKKLYWRGHHILDEQFPVWMLDGSSRMHEACSVLLRRTVEDSEQPEPSRSDVALPMFSLRDLGENGLRKWLDLYQDPVLRRAIEPVVEVINGASRFLEPQVLMTVLALDAMGYYRDEHRSGNIPLFKQIERCLGAAGIDFSSIGPALGIAKAIANTNNDLKHPDRQQRPDPVHMSLVARLSIAVMRLQLFDLLGLPEESLTRCASYDDIRQAINGFGQAGVKIDATGKFVSQLKTAVEL
ncbi:MAG: hypothetical protein ABWY04_09475 [Arthrobacter sp.]